MQDTSLCGVLFGIIILSINECVAKGGIVVVLVSSAFLPLVKV